MPDEKKIQSIAVTRDRDGSFCPSEMVDRIDDLFFVRERDGRAVEKQLGIRRTLLETGLRHAINRYRDPNGPKPMVRANGAQPFVVRRTA